MAQFSQTVVHPSFDDVSDGDVEGVWSSLKAAAKAAAPVLKKHVPVMLQAAGSSGLLGPYGALASAVLSGMTGAPNPAPMRPALPGAATKTPAVNAPAALLAQALTQQPVLQLLGAALGGASAKPAATVAAGGKIIPASSVFQLLAALANEAAKAAPKPSAKESRDAEALAPGLDGVATLLDLLQRDGDEPSDALVGEDDDWLEDDSSAWYGAEPFATP
ncbi:MAG: hypothetical protein AAF799_41165 [Myxococcota bacterium]